MATKKAQNEQPAGDTGEGTEASEPKKPTKSKASKARPKSKSKLGNDWRTTAAKAVEKGFRARLTKPLNAYKRGNQRFTTEWQEFLPGELTIEQIGPIVRDPLLEVDV